MMPQARLQPSAPRIMVLTSARPAVITLSVPVLVNTMIRPNRISETRSIGSSQRTEALPRLSVIALVGPAKQSETRSASLARASANSSAAVVGRVQTRQPGKVPRYLVVAIRLVAELEVLQRNVVGS